MNWKGCGRKRSLPYLRDYLVICLEGPRETTRNLSGLSVCGPRFEPGTSRIRSRNVNHSTTKFGSSRGAILQYCKLKERLSGYRNAERSKHKNKTLYSAWHRQARLTSVDPEGIFHFFPEASGENRQTKCDFFLGVLVLMGSAADTLLTSIKRPYSSLVVA
jgi:hypothetical protein